MINNSDLRSSDVVKLLGEIGNESTSLDRIKSILEMFFVHTSKNKDFAHILLEKGVIKILIGLYNSTKGKGLKEIITSVFLLLGSNENGKNENSVLDVAISALSHIIPDSNVNVFLEIISGVKDITTSSNEPSTSCSASSTSSSSSSSSPFSSPSSRHPISVLSSALILEKTATILSSSSPAAEHTKQGVLDALLEVVDTGTMNEAAEFGAWRQSQGPSVLSAGGGGGGGGRGGGGGDSEAPAELFTKALKAFTEAVKELSLVKRRGGLYASAREVYQALQDGKFFPMFGLSLVNLPLKFLGSSASFVANTGSKLVWNSGTPATFFVDPEINAGLYKVIIDVNSVSGSYYNVGLANKSLFNTIATGYLYSSTGACCINSINGYLYCGGSNVSGSVTGANPPKATLGLELDANKHILYFFVNDVQLPVCVTNVPAGVHFAVSSAVQNNSFELKSLSKLAVPTINAAVTCTQYGWK